MLAIFLKTLPFFLLIGLGWAAAGTRFFPPEAAAWLTRFVFYFALSAMLDGGYEIYMVEDASGGTSKAAHDYSMQRMIQAGVVPMTWQQVMLEWQRDWAHKETYDAVISIAQEHSGAYGMGIDYARTMVHNVRKRVAHGERIGPNPAI